jgi:hypothetical protein
LPPASTAAKRKRYPQTPIAEGEFTMTRPKLLAASLLAMAFFGSPAIAQKDGIFKRPDPTQPAIDDVKEILLLMNTDTNGRITRQEWIRFMTAEFDRLDPAKKGSLDPTKITPVKKQARPTLLQRSGKVA